MWAVLILTVSMYLKSLIEKSLNWGQWKWTSTDSDPFGPHQDALEKWLMKYPKIDPHRAHKAFTCESWSCRATFGTKSRQWIEPRLEYKTLGNGQTLHRKWMELHQSQNTQLTDIQQSCDYLFIGDSITFSWTRHSTLFDEEFNTDHNGMIYAESGDKIHEIGWRLSKGGGFENMRQCISRGTASKKAIVLLIGTNDIGSGTSYDIVLKDYAVLLDQFAEFIEELNSHQQEVVLYVMGIFPRSDQYTPFAERTQPITAEQAWNEGNHYFLSVQIVNEYLKSYADLHRTNNIQFVDCNHEFLDKTEMMEWRDQNGGLHQFETGVITTEMMDDMLHLTAKGYERWTDCLRQHL